MESFTYVKRGYDPEEVDRYIATLEQVIKSYKEKDNTIKNAIISAQAAADNIIQNAKNQANEYKTQIAKELDKIPAEIERQRIRIQAFQDVYSGLVRKYLTTLEESEMNDIFTRLDDIDKLITRLKETDIIPPSGTPMSTDSSEEAAVFTPPSEGTVPILSFGPDNSPSLNKPAARVNEEGNYVPN